MARDNAAMPACFAQSNMAEICLISLRAMHIVPFLGTWWVYVAINQVVALCSQNPSKCSIAEVLKEL